MNSQIYSDRLARVRSLMQLRAIDYLIAGPSADLYYLLGVQHRPSERLALLVVPQVSPASFVLPRFESVGVGEVPEGVQVVPWGESDNPARLVASLIATPMGAHPGGAQCTIAVSDRLWSIFLLHIQAELPRAAFTWASQLLPPLRQTKSPEEIELLKASASRADDAFREMVTRPFVGRTEVEIATELAGLLKGRGLQVEGMPIVASGPNGASPHHHAGERTIQRGDEVVLDFGGTYGGYYSDMTRTVFAGVAPRPDSEEARVYRLVADAQELGVSSARPGVTAEELDATVRASLAAAGYGDFFTHRLGHGIGLDGHEPPYLVHGNETALQPGMTFSIEPGLYLPGKFGVRIEDIVVLTETGAQRLNNATRDAVVVG